MLPRLKSTLFYNETRPFIQKNVLVLTQLSPLFVIAMFNDYLKGDFNNVGFDISILTVIFLIWFGVKKQGVYYSNLVFLILMPLFGWLIAESLSHYGSTSVIWSFPIIAVLFFCFHEYLAWLATAIIFLITVVTYALYFPNEQIFSVTIALTMVVFCLISVFSNVHRHYAILEDKSKRDPMTGLLNRSSLKNRLLSSIAMQKPSLSTVVISIDLDDFKYINDKFGHREGDNVLIEFSQILTSNLRQTDSVFRMGGEEFLIILNDIVVVDARNIAETIRANIATSNIIKNHTTTVSIGLVEYQEHYDWYDWLKRADDAMYQAKHTGKNKIVCF